MNSKLYLIIPDNLISTDERHGIEDLSNQSTSVTVFEHPTSPTNSFHFLDPNNIKIIVDFITNHPVVSYVVGKEIFDPLYDKIVRPILVKLINDVKSKAFMELRVGEEPKLADIYIETKVSNSKIITAVRAEATEEEMKQAFTELINARHTLEGTTELDDYYFVKEDAEGNSSVMSIKEYIAHKSSK